MIHLSALINKQFKNIYLTLFFANFADFLQVKIMHVHTIFRLSRCKFVDCKRLKRLTGGNVVYLNETTHLGSVVQFSCERSHQLKGKGPRRLLIKSGIRKIICWSNLTFQRVLEGTRGELKFFPKKLFTQFYGLLEYQVYDGKKIRNFLNSEKSVKIFRIFILPMGQLIKINTR